MASVPTSDPVVNAEITGAKLVDLKILDGRIVGGRIIEPRRAREKAPRAFHIDIGQRHSEIVAILGLGLAFLLMYTL